MHFDAAFTHRGYLLTENEHFLEPLEWARRDVPGRLKRLDELLTADSAQQAHLAQMHRLILLKLEFIDGSDALLRSGDRSGAIERVRTGRGKQLMDGIRAHCRAMLDHEELQLAERKHEAEAAERRHDGRRSVALLAHADAPGGEVHARALDVVEPAQRRLDAADAGGAVHARHRKLDLPRAVAEIAGGDRHLLV